MESPVIFYVFMIGFVCSSYADVCTGDQCQHVITMPLLDDMKATLKADLDVTNMNNHLKSYIQQEIQKGVEIAMRDEMKKLVNEGVEKISSTVEATVDKQVTSM